MKTPKAAAVLVAILFLSTFCASAALAASSDATLVVGTVDRTEAGTFALISPSGEYLVTGVDIAPFQGRQVAVKGTLSEGAMSQTIEAVSVKALPAVEAASAKTMPPVESLIVGSVEKTGDNGYVLVAASGEYLVTGVDLAPLKGREVAVQGTLSEGPMSQTIEAVSVQAL